MNEHLNAWTTVALGDVCDLYQPKTIATKDLVPDGPYTVFGANGIIGRYTSYNHAESEVLITCRGATCGTINLSQPYSWITGNAMVARPRDNRLDKRFLRWALSYCDFSDIITGSAQPQITRSKLAPLQIRMPVLDEQLLIAQIIEEQFSRLDAAEASLDKSSDRLPRLAISVMNELLSREWPVVRASEVAEIRLGRQRSPKNHSGPSMRPYLRAANVTWHGLALSDVKEMNFSDTEAPTYELRSGDILIAEASGSASEVGKVAIWRDEIPRCCFQNTLLRVRAKGNALPEYLQVVFQFAALSGQFGRAAAGVGIHHLGAQRLNSWPVPLPPLEEQGRIVSHLQQYLSVFEDVRNITAAVRRRSAALRHAILGQAFSGYLTRQYGLAARISGHVLGDNARIEIGVG